MQQYQFTERFEYVKTIEFKNSQPLHVQKIRFFKEEEITGLFIKKEFRYSFDNVIWTNWNTLTQANLANIEFRDRHDFYLEVVYTRPSLSAGNISRWYLYYDGTAPTPPVPTPDASIDADTLKGEGPAYYLDRAHHEGPYTELNILDVPDGSNVGVYHSRVDSSLGTTFYFKRVIGTQGIIVTDSSAGLITFRLNPDIYSNIVLDSSLGADFYWSNGYLEVSTACCDQLKIYIDGSLASRDASIEWLYNNRTVGSVTEASLGTDFYWDSGFLGVSGSQGIQGIIGSQGVQGIQGTLGVQGVQGIQGQIGIQGVIGVQGKIGTQGTLGVQGIQGTIGSQGIQGTQGIQGKLGVQGTRGIQGTRGAQGIIGSQGLQGVQGIRGSKGIQGTVGSQGLGVQGTQGVQGKLGAQGTRGIQGREGAQGLGVQGTQGVQGIQGLSIQGAQGKIGPQGLCIQGTQGTFGIQGAQGKIGPQGLCIQGTQGTFGIQGAQGIPGAFSGQGVQGTEGSQGVQGTQGIGSQGVQGTQGSQGIQGIQGSNQDASLNELYAWQIAQDTSIMTIGGGVYNTTLDVSLTMPNPVGGIPAGTSVADLYGDSFIQLFDDLLFPTVNPSLYGPSASMTVGPTVYLYEVSSNVALTFTSILNRGSIDPQYTALSPYRSGLPNNFNFTGPGLIDASSSAIPYVSPVINVSIGLIQSWNVAISYDQGVQPYDNKGNPYDSPLAPGTVTSSPIIIRGSYPFFATTINTATLTQQPLMLLSTNPYPDNTNGIELAAEPDEIDKQKIDVPSILSVIGIQTKDTIIGWFYEGFSGDGLDMWTQSTVYHTIQGYSVAYNRYTYAGVQRAETKIKLLF